MYVCVYVCTGCVQLRSLDLNRDSAQFRYRGRRRSKEDPRLHQALTNGI